MMYTVTGCHTLRMAKQAPFKAWIGNTQLFKILYASDLLNIYTLYEIKSLLT